LYRPDGVAADEAWERSIAGFFFLRYICPALVTPFASGLLHSNVDSVSQRKFVLIVKVRKGVLVILVLFCLFCVFLRLFYGCMFSIL
jgi:hypothetical protein